MAEKLQDIRRKMGVEIYNRISPIIGRQLQKELNLFLIGSSLLIKTSLRSQMYECLKLSKNVGVHFPEHFFDEQLFQNNIDLLTLENLLAQSVDGVVMCIESPGSFAELGAFANHKDLRNKLLVYVDKKYEKHRSFINLGPIKLLKKQNRSSVVAFDFRKGFDVNNEGDLLHRMRDIKKKNPVDYSLKNLLFAQRFVLTISYIIGEYTRKDIIETLKGIVDDDVDNAITVVDSCLSMLVRRRELTFKNEQYALSPQGRQKVMRELGTASVYKHLDTYRVKMLNLSLRKYWVNGQS